MTRELKLYPAERHWWSFNDYRAVLGVVVQLQPATVLEFGPGSSTLALLEGGAGHIDALEDDAKWIAVNSNLLLEHAARVSLIPYVWADPLAIPAIDARRYDLALIDGPRTTENRVAVLEYCLTRAAAVLMPLEESADRHGQGYLRPHVMAAAARHGRSVALIESGPLSGTFALLT